MTENEILEVMKYISDTDKKCASDVIYALSLLSTNINIMLECIKDDIYKCAENNDFSDIGQLSGYCANITTMRDEIERCIDVLVKQGVISSENKPETKKETSSPISVPSQVDYSNYKVNPTEEHRIDEDFENTKICAYMLDGKKTYVDSWQELTVSICSYLAKKDPSKINSFTRDYDFIGKKNNYFMTEFVKGRNKPIPGTNLYVWINQNANALSKMIINILKKYGYSRDDIKIFLRADYSDLHK